jgi:uncharacterized protein YjdB
LDETSGEIMRNRLWWVASLVIGLVIPLTGCSNPSGLDSITVSPTSQSLGVGQTSQLTVSGTYGNASHAATKAVTGGISWTSNTPAVATVSGSGVVTAVGAGTATIVASATGFNGPVSSSATITVTAASGSGGAATGSVASIAIIPGTQSVAPTQTTQFIAIGTTSSGATEDLTGQVTWSSSAKQIATIGATTGLATAVTPGSVTITAIYSAGTGASVTGTATFSVTGTASQEAFTALAITPGSQALSASGQTGQFIAIATNGSGLQEIVTNSVTWTSSMPSVATIGANSGLATGVSVGTTSITAILTNSDNTVVTATATISVSLTSPPEPILSLQIIPATISVGDLQDTGQFLAIGTFSTPPYVRDLTNSPNTTWISSFPNDFPVDTNSGGNSGASAGLVTAYASGSATIIAESTNPLDGTIQTATAQFNCPLALPNPGGDPPTAGSCYAGNFGPLLATLTVYNQGLNTSNWLVTAPSATGTPNVIHCGPGWAADGNTGGSVCTATYPIGTTVTLTAPAQTGVNFGGWSNYCNPTPPVTAAGPNSCTVTLGATNATVGAIFN